MSSVNTKNKNENLYSIEKFLNFNAGRIKLVQYII